MRALANTVKEVARIQDVERALVPTVFNGGTRVTGLVQNRDWDAYVPGLADHVLVALQGGLGETFYSMDGKSSVAPIRAGLVSVIPRGRDAYWRSTGTPVSNVFLSHERLLECAERIGPARDPELLCRVGVADSKLYTILKLLSLEAEHGADCSRLFIEHALDLACIHLIRAHSALERSSIRPRRGLAPWQVKRVTAYMRQNLDQDIGLEELAAAVKLSRFYFCSAFRMATGYTPHEWLTRLRIDEARRLLSLGAIPITDVALAVGYQTSSAFAAAFRRLVGVSPREFRRNL